MNQRMSFTEKNTDLKVGQGKDDTSKRFGVSSGKAFDEDSRMDKLKRTEDT